MAKRGGRGGKREIIRRRQVIVRGVFMISIVLVCSSTRTDECELLLLLLYLFGRETATTSGTRDPLVLPSNFFSNSYARNALSNRELFPEEETPTTRARHVCLRARNPACGCHRRVLLFAATTVSPMMPVHH